jgi:methylthioribose-1-phosphate isomerase
MALLTNGNVGSVCASDYGTQLSQIGSLIEGSLSSFALACSPISGTFKITLSPADSAANPTLSGSTVTFAHPLAPGTAVNGSYSCTAS